MPKFKPTPAEDDAAIMQLQIRLPASTLRRLKVRAAKEGRPMSSQARLYIMQGLKKPVSGAAP